MPINNLTGYTIILVMKMPKPIDNFLTYSKGKYKSMHENARYTSLSAQLTKLDDANTKLNDSQTGFKAKPRTVQKETRDADNKTARLALRTLASGVQAMATADPANAEKIISEAGFDVKKVATHEKHGLKIMDGTESGSVIIEGEGKGPQNFRQSWDGIEWFNLVGSKNYRKIVRNLPVGKTVYFQTSIALNDGEEGEWSQTLSIVVR
jgi:hypothetical protein